MNRRYRIALAMACVVGLPAIAQPASDADSNDVHRKMEDIKQQQNQSAEELKQDHEQRIIELERRLDELKSSALAPAVPGPVAPVPQAPAAAAQGGAGAFQLSLNILGAGGMSSVNDPDLSGLQAGGHDPSRNGFTIQNVELTLAGAVDPYLDAQANFIFLINADGETLVELEEAFLMTRALPWGLQVKAGQSFLEFGRQNQQHPHSWNFVDQPIIMSRLFGPDGLRSQGARVSWLASLPWYSEFYLGVYNARGETVTSFLSDEASQVGGYQLSPQGGARQGSDFLYLGRWLNGFDVSDETSVNAGMSVLRGPNATAAGVSTTIYGADLYLKWRATINQRGFPFFGWQTEVMQRDYEAVDTAGLGLVNTTLRDWGYYTQVLWGFSPGWIAALRVEQAKANDPNGDAATDPLRDRRWRISPNLTWYPTESSKLRLQYNHDGAQHLADGTADSLWLQFEVGIGSHAAHKF